MRPENELSVRSFRIFQIMIQTFAYSERDEKSLRILFTLAIS